MAAPTVSTRLTPYGTQVDEGLGTKISCTNNTDIGFWEMSVKPPDIEGGEGNSNTTLFNTTYKTKVPKTLIEMGEVSGKCFYRLHVQTEIVALINVNTSWTIKYPNGDTETFFGWLRSFKREPLEEGKKPEAAYQIELSNWDPVNRVEQGPVYTPASGT